MLIDPDDVGIDRSELDRLARIAGALDHTDFELEAPPAGLWDRIAASIAAEPQDTRVGSGTVVEYAIDADDVVISVGADWSSFARGNAAPELDELAADRTLWSYIDEDEVRDLWRLLVDQVRAKQARARVPLRCDAPDMRRWFEMTVTPEPGDVVRFRSVLVFEEARPVVALLSDGSARDAARSIPVCSWCGDAHDGSGWHPVEEVVRSLRLLEEGLPRTSYGICPSCRDLMSVELLAPGRHAPDSPG